MELHCKIAGCLLMALAGLHLVFPSYFKWKKEMSALSLINRQIVYVHTFFIGLILFLTGWLCLAEATQIIATELGRKLSLGLSFFWFVRLLFQWFVYSPKLWRGKRFETVVHVVFTMLWLYFTVVFFMIYYLAI